MNARLLLVAASASSATLAGADYKARVSITLPAVERPMAAAIVFRGRDFYRWTGYPRPAVGSLLLRGRGGPVALQVEEVDAAGRLVAKGDGRLDDNDRVAFAVELGRQPCRIWLYYDGPAVAQRGEPAVAVKKQPKQLHSLLLTAGKLTVGLHGGGKGAGVHAIENYGRGALALSTWQGQTLADVRGSWGNYFPRTIASQKDAPPWSEPAVVVHGPVRTVVEMHCNGYRLASGNKEILKGDVTHYIAVWGACPVIDFEEVVDYTASGFAGTWPYSGQIPVGKAQDEHDRLIVPLAGKAHVVELGQTAAEVAKHPWRTLYATDNPEEGWFAWQDTAEKVGLATFYERMPSIAYRAAWVTYRPALHPDVYTRTTLWNAPETRLSFKDRALRCRSRYRREIRYAALRDETPNDVRALYHLWGRTLDAAAEVGWPETKP